jgi:hypothetical protein
MMQEEVKSVEAGIEAIETLVLIDDHSRDRFEDELLFLHHCLRRKA